MRVTSIIAFSLVIIGAIVWGMIGIFNFNIVSRIIYSVVGISALWLLFYWLTFRPFRNIG